MRTKDNNAMQEGDPRGLVGWKGTTTGEEIKRGGVVAIRRQRDSQRRIKCNPLTS